MSQRQICKKQEKSSLWNETEYTHQLSLDFHVEFVEESGGHSCLVSIHAIVREQLLCEAADPGFQQTDIQLPVETPILVA